MRTFAAGMNQESEEGAGEAAEGVGDPIEMIGAAAAGGNELVVFIGGAIKREGEGGSEEDFAERPFGGPAPGEGHGNAAAGEGDEVGGFVPEIEEVHLLDVGA